MQLTNYTTSRRFENGNRQDDKQKHEYGDIVSR